MFIACMWALLGERERAVEWLAAAAANGEAFPCDSFFRADPLLLSLRGEDRFETLLDELVTECARYRRLYEELWPGVGQARSVERPTSST